MRLMHPSFSVPIRFEENSIQVLIVENPALFSDMHEDLVAQVDGGEGEFVLSKSFEPVEISSILEVVVDYFHLCREQKRMQTKLISLLKNLAQQEFQIETASVYEQLTAYMEQLIKSVDYSVSFSLPDDVGSLIKIAKVHFESDSGTLAERLLNYMTVCSELLGMSCFVLMNLKSYLTESELRKLYKMVLYKKINILLLESTQKNIITEYECVRLIDEDLCELYLANNT